VRDSHPAENIFLSDLHHHFSLLHIKL